MAAVLLTGANGYLGSAVAAELTRQRIAWSPLAGRLQDIPAASLAPDCVIHCAGALRHQAERLQHDNVLGTARLLAGLRTPARIVFASSRSVYGAPAGALCAESDEPAPRDDYGRSKYAAEQLLRDSGLPTLCSRLSTLFGAAPRGDCPALPNLALRRWQRGEPVQLVAGDFEVDYLAVGDAARLLVALAQQPQWPADVLNLPGPQRGLHALMQQLAGAARQQDLPAALHHDHPGAGVWPRLDGARLRAWLPDFRFSSDADVAAAFLAQPVVRD